MDAIKKKMNSLKSETLQLQSTIEQLEEQTKQANKISEQCDIDIRCAISAPSLMEMKLTFWPWKLMELNQADDFGPAGPGPAGPGPSPSPTNTALRPIRLSTRSTWWPTDIKVLLHSHSLLTQR